MFYRIWARLLPTKSVDTIVAALTTIAKQLADAEARENDLAAKAEAAAVQHRDAAARAQRVGSNISALTV